MEKIYSHQTDLSRYDNSWYQPGSRLKILSWFLISRICINTYLPIPVKFKILVLNFFGAKIASSAVIKPKVNIKYPWNLRVEEYVWIGENVWIDSLGMVTLESNVCLSQGCMLQTGNHDFTKSTFDLMVKPITIKKGAWIGAKAVVCPGVTVGSHALLTINSVATKNLNPNSIYQGNPAIFVKHRNISS